MMIYTSDHGFTRSPDNTSSHTGTGGSRPQGALLLISYHQALCPWAIGLHLAEL